MIPLGSEERGLQLFQKRAERFRLVRYLYRGGLERRQVLDLFRLIEWLTRLPQDWELRFEQELASLEGRTNMMTTDSILSSIEVRAIEKGRQEGRQEGLEQGRRQAIVEALEERFGPVSEEARAKVEAMADEGRLRRAHRLAITAPSMQHFLENA